MFDIKTDFVSDHVCYRGEAKKGSSESDKVWKIVRMTSEGDVIEGMVPNGSNAYEFAWTQRKRYTYKEIHQEGPHKINV